VVRCLRVRGVGCVVRRERRRRCVRRAGRSSHPKNENYGGNHDRYNSACCWGCAMSTVEKLFELWRWRRTEIGTATCVVGGIES